MAGPLDPRTIFRAIFWTIFLDLFFGPFYRGGGRPLVLGAGKDRKFRDLCRLIRSMT